MNRRDLLGFVGAGLLWGRARESRPLAAEPALPEILASFATVDWQRHAVMTKPPGQQPPWRLRLEAEHRAARNGAAAVEPLLRYSEHASPHVRGLAAQMLGVIGEAGARERLLTLVARDPSGLVRNYAVEAASRLAGAARDSAITAAIAAARSDGNRNVAFSAQQAQLRFEQNVPGGAPLRAKWTEGFDAERLGSAAVGQTAPAFELVADDGAIVRLSDYRGRRSVVLLFQLADW